MNAIEVMARAMCLAAGDDPDQMAYPAMQHRYAISKQFVLIVPTAEYEQPRPLWQHHAHAAKAALEALRDYPPAAADREAWALQVHSLLDEEAS